MGNWGPGATGFTLGVYGDIDVTGFGGANGTLAVTQICLKNDTCRTTWPSGGGGPDIWVDTVGDTMTGKLTVNVGAGNIAVEGNGGARGGYFTGDQYGVYGSSGAGLGGFFLGDGYGVLGQSFTQAGIAGLGVTYGAIGQADPAVGTGVYGYGRAGGNFIAANNGTALIANGTAPGAKAAGFEVNGPTSVMGVRNWSNSGWSSIDFHDTANNVQAYTGFGNAAVGDFPNTAYFGTSGANPTALVTSGARRLYVTSGGNVGINNLAPAAKLDVTGGGGANVDMIVNGRLRTGDAAGLGGMFVDSAGTMFFGQSGPGRTGIWNAGWRLEVTNAGNVGIGTAAPDQKLTVNGGASKPGGGSWSVFSDRRLKNLDGDFVRGLDEIMQLDPVYYHYKAGNKPGLPTDKQYVGLVAQDVQQAIPEAVETNGNGQLMLNNDPIIWAMLNALKELKAENDALKARVGELEKE